MTDAKPKRRWFRFSLRSLLAVVTLAGVASWYWISWPWWVAYREQVRVETAIRHLKAGTPPSFPASLDAARSVVRAVTFKRVSELPEPDDKHPEIVLLPYVTERAVYCICFVVAEKPRSDRHAPSTSLEAFRLPRMPKNYQPKMHLKSEPELDYIADFFSIHTGENVDDHRIQYELIYSDPPAK